MRWQQDQHSGGGLHGFRAGDLHHAVTIDAGAAIHADRGAGRTALGAPAATVVGWSRSLADGPRVHPRPASPSLECPHAPSSHPDPRRRHRARAGGGDSPRPRRVRRRVRLGGRTPARPSWGSTARRFRTTSSSRSGAIGSPSRVRSHARRRGLPLRQRHAAPGPRPVCERPPGAVDQGPRHPLRERRSRDRAREHRGPVRGHRAPVGPDAAESIKIITRAASERIARYAFEYAVANGGTRSRPCTRRTS